MTSVGPGATGREAWRRLAARLGIDMRPGEATPVLLLFSCFFLFTTFQYTTKAVRQSAYIDGLGAANLPWVYLTVALCSYPLLRLYSALADRLKLHQLIAATSGLIATSMVVFYWLFQYSWRWIPFTLYVWISIVYVMNFSQFWSFSNHLLDPRQAKRLFGFIGAGGLLGGVAGGQVARVVSRWVDTRTNFLVAAVILLAAGGLILVVNRYRPTDVSSVAGAVGLKKLDRVRGGFEALKSSRQLRLIAALMLLTVMVAQIVDVQFNWVAEESTSDLDDATRFFGNFFSIMGITAFLFQLAFTSRIHRRLGVGVAMRVLPSTMALGSTAVLGAFYLVPGLLLASALLVKIGENGLRYSLEQSTRELLFLPVPSQARIKGKVFIDVFVQRSAKGLAAILLLPVTPAIAWISPPVLAGWLAFPLIAVWFVVIRSVYREYVRSFRRGLETRKLDAEVPINMSDAATLELLVQSLGSSDRRQVVQSLELLEINNRGNLVPPLLLYHDDPEVRRRTLRIIGEVERLDALPLVERALTDEDPEVRAEAIQVLGKLHGEDVCELMLPRLHEADVPVRAAAVACVANHGDEPMVGEATSALEDMLSDADPAVRSEAAKALGAIREPRFQESLIRLLYDRDVRVVRDAISSINRRVGRDGFNPIYVPTLISLLQSRRIKHEAREALTAFGEPALPALAHFMGDADEPLWVRRALPKTVARIGTLAAASALTERLEQVEDAFQRWQLVEALGSLPGDIRRSLDGRVLEVQIRQEAGRYLQTLADLRELGLLDKGHLEGPCISWSSQITEPSLLDRLLAERLEGHLRTLFGLAALLHPPRDVWAAHRSLISGRIALRNHALEYLDNTLTGEVRRAIFAVIGDDSLEEKLLEAGREFGTESGSRVGALERLLDEYDQGTSDEHHLTLATLYLVHTDRIEALYPRVKSLVDESEDPFVNETAIWVAKRVGLSAEA